MAGDASKHYEHPKARQRWLELSSSTLALLCPWYHNPLTVWSTDRGDGGAVWVGCELLSPFLLVDVVELAESGGLVVPGRLEI